MYVIGGLGNPGQCYSTTRHNIGFMVIRDFARSLGVSPDGRRFESKYTRTSFKEKEIILLRPQTFMNLSGRAVKACVDRFHVNEKNILIIHDDIDLPVGRIRVSRGGGGGGHKGVLSIIQHLGTRQFPRVKLGVGRPRHGEPIEEYVLRSFYKDETEVITQVIQEAVQACFLFLTDGVEAAMNQINSHDLAKRKEVFG